MQNILCTKCIDLSEKWGKIAEYLIIKELRAFKMNKSEWKDSGFCSETGL